MQDLSIVKVPDQKVIGVRKTGSYQLIPQRLGELYQYATEHGAQITGPPIYLCHEQCADEVKKADEAGTADIEEANNNPLETIKKNVLGNGIILEACKMNEVKRYLFSSSLYVYSNFGDFYRSSKQACELFIENYNKLFGLPYTILRYGSLYGPRSDKSNYIFRILKQAITKGEIVSFGESEDLREYIHVEDAARYSVDILSEEFKNQYIIITGNQPMRRKELLVMIKEMFNNKIDIKFTKKKSDFHYNITPYSFSPKIAKKYSGKYHLDMGQGLLQCIDEIYKDCKHIKQLNGVIIKNGVNDALETEDE